MTISGGAPGASAPAENPRPARIRRPQRSMRFAVTRDAVSRFASPRPVSVTFVRVEAPIASNDVSALR